MGAKRAYDVSRRAKGLANTTYHVTGHGIDEIAILDRYVEKRTFINLLCRYLSREPFSDTKGRLSVKHFDAASLLAFCVMDNHFHLVIHQIKAQGLEKLMRSLLTSYAMWFNGEHHRRGPILRERYAATPILTHDHAKQAIAYVHLNEPRAGIRYEHTSHDYYVGHRSADWIDVEAGLAVFGGRDAYLSYLHRRGPTIVERKLQSLK